MGTTEELDGSLKESLKEHGYHSPIFLGEGSFSSAYRVLDEMGHFWVCKVADGEREKLWQQECENWQEIRHPLFPSYREHWTDGGKGYLIIEFWEGMDLREMLARRRRLAPGQAAQILSQIAEGVQYLHERPHPFLYRDLKPENIRIRSNGRVGILDLGCLWNREQGWSGAGNYFYSAPEQFRPGEIPGEESDVYALGKLLAAMLGEDKGRDRRWRDRRRKKWLRRLIAMATDKERDSRIPDCKTLQELLTVMDASYRIQKQTLKRADFYYIRKLYYP